MTWDAITSIATVISTLAFIVTALYVRAELKALEKDRYLAITNQLFVIWETRDFMDAQLWLLHRLKETSWQEFIAAHRADIGEIAFHRVGSFYDRVGALVRLHLVKKEEILTTIGGHAIAVWQKIQPLVQEARRIEHSNLFIDFETLLPSCYQCYVPSLGPNVQVNPFALVQPEKHVGRSPRRISQASLKSRLDSGDAIALVDVRPSEQQARDPRTLPGAIAMPAEEVERRYRELPADREIILYCA